MNGFTFKRKALHAEDVSLERIAQDYGTPTYVYSTAALHAQLEALRDAFGPVDPLVCYSVKASSNLALLKLFADAGTGFDIVSGGELRRVLKAGGAPPKVVFSGVGKTETEMREALVAGILLFNVESEEELRALDRVGQSLKRKAPFAIRVNPDVDPKTHRHIATGLKSSKFGVDMNEAGRLYRTARKLRGVEALGVDCHIGSQLTDMRPLRKALKRLAAFYVATRGEGSPLQWLDVGGGLGVGYEKPAQPLWGEYARVVREETGGCEARIILEPGRSLVADAAVLLTRVVLNKRTDAKQFVVVDAAMNDLMRPALYDAHHRIVPVKSSKSVGATVDIVGPVCESTDVLARNRALPRTKTNDLLAIMTAGAYGMSMASTYNSRPRPAEVLVSGPKARVIRARESIDDLWRGEST